MAKLKINKGIVKDLKDALRAALLTNCAVSESAQKEIGLYLQTWVAWPISTALKEIDPDFTPPKGMPVLLNDTSVKNEPQAVKDALRMVDHWYAGSCSLGELLSAFKKAAYMHEAAEEDKACFNGNHPRDVNGYCLIDGGKS